MPLLTGFAGTAWNGLFVLLSFIFVLGIVVFVHEMGHFLVARWCGVKVKVFSMGMGREIPGCNFTDRHGTRWCLARWPIGGYVKFMDDENGASVPSREIIAAMTPEQRAGSFHAKPLLQRTAVVAAGPIANFLLAICIFALIATFIGIRTVDTRINALASNSPAAKAGLRPGDTVLAVNGRHLGNLGDLDTILSTDPKDPLTLTVNRDGHPLEATVVPELRSVPDGIGGTFRYGFIGIGTEARVEGVFAGSPAQRAGLEPDDLIVRMNGREIGSFEDVVTIVAANPGTAIPIEIRRGDHTLSLSVTPTVPEPTASGKPARPTIGISRKAPGEMRKINIVLGVAYGVAKTEQIISTTLGYIGHAIVKQENPEQFGGPIRIAAISGEVAKLGIEPLFLLIAGISVSVGLVNLFPIPLLDGGHLLFYAIEAIRRRPLSEYAQDLGFRIGLAVVLMLMLYSTWNDLPILRSWVTGAG